PLFPNSEVQPGLSGFVLRDERRLTEFGIVIGLDSEAMREISLRFFDPRRYLGSVCETVDLNVEREIIERAFKCASGASGFF
ncbi:MAG: hypothetical protein ACREIW_09785, partial [Chthoniobacterales bacterium]